MYNVYVTPSLCSTAYVWTRKKINNQRIYIYISIHIYICASALYGSYTIVLFINNNSRLVWQKLREGPILHNSCGIFLGFFKSWSSWTCQIMPKIEWFLRIWWFSLLLCNDSCVWYLETYFSIFVWESWPFQKNTCLFWYIQIPEKLIPILVTIVSFISEIH